MAVTSGVAARARLRPYCARAAHAALTRWRRRALLLIGCALLLVAPARAATPQTLLVLGDSLSAEYGLARGQGWVALLQQRLQAEGAAWQVENASVSGETSSGGLARLPALLARTHPAIVIVELGANDGLRGLSLDASRGNLDRILGAVRQSGARAVLVGMRIPPNYGLRYAEDFHAMFGKLARQHRVALVPFLLAPIAERPDMFQADRLHPIAQAQPLLLDTVWPVLKPMLGPVRR